ncbi:MAG TPA: class I SAM-dependent methyltransferase [Thermodesulfovibrionales bacterium]|nr:class I SAM-dependent methyltransferase [Thermodesulfovibrionales bacterium]
MNFRKMVSFIYDSLFRREQLHFWRNYSRAVEGFYKIHFLHAAKSSGLLSALESPTDLAGLATKLKTERIDLLEVLCELGVKCGYMYRADDRFALSCDLMKLLKANGLDAILAYTEEISTLQGTALNDLPSNLHSFSPVTYLEGKGILIARSSILFEHDLKKLIRAAMPQTGAVRILEIGCGSGIYLFHASEINSEVSGIAIDKEDDAIKLASQNLSRWKLSGKFQLIKQDILAFESEGKTFDVITLYNNIYYFKEEEQIKLFNKLRGLLIPGGKLVIAAAMQGGHIRSVVLDLLVRSSIPRGSLPTKDNLIKQLSSCGFNKINAMSLNPSGSYIGIIAQ